MPYKVSFDETDRIIKVQVFGLAAHADHCAARDEAWKFCRENECPRILVDLRKLNTERSSTVDCFSFGQSLAQSSPGVRFALVMPKQAKSKQDVKFTTTVEANRGVQVQTFDTIEEARKWLLKEE
jgi:hypothetical protein